jgi:hypothetical protein
MVRSDRKSVQVLGGGLFRRAHADINVGGLNIEVGVVKETMALVQGWAVDEPGGDHPRGGRAAAAEDHPGLR